MTSRRAFLGIVLGASLIALNACTRGTEDPAKTKLFATFFTSVLAGDLREDGLDGTMRAVLTQPRVNQLRDSYRSLGTFKSLRFLGQDEVPGYHRYYYVATFSGGSQGLMFVLDGSGKISGFFNQ